MCLKKLEKNIKISNEILMLQSKKWKDKKKFIFSKYFILVEFGEMFIFGKKTVRVFVINHFAFAPKILKIFYIYIEFLC